MVVSPFARIFVEMKVKGVPLVTVESIIPEYVIPSGRISVIKVPLPFIVNAALSAVSSVSV